MIMSTMLASVAEGMCLSDTLGLSSEALIEVGGCYSARGALSLIVLVTGIADADMVCCRYPLTPIVVCCPLQRPDD